eukprot:TRINITY_DN61775_c0_g1_i1.p2 TRINITY_DN61775_c0_g1~~TRINITY_DN61775_c0_g1_i1.p2  ORF type:complete len:586 (+),score=217.63 TRINITY_DN61775_c0_g1_i1:71-1759(+)
MPQGAGSPARPASAGALQAMPADWGEPPQPHKMRLFVRVKGSSPFVLVLQDNLLLEHYKEIAANYFRRKWEQRSTLPCPALVLVRAIRFRNCDRLLDFKRRRARVHDPLELPGARAGEVGEPAGGVYCESYSPDVIRQNMVVTNPTTTPIIENCETELIVKTLSLDRLIMKITDPFSAQYLSEVFWDTYREYARPPVVLQKFLERYEVPPLVTDGEPQRTPTEHAYHQRLRYQIQMRVVQQLEHWVKTAYFDFTDDMTRTLFRWAVTRMDRDGIPSTLTQLMKQREADRVPLEAQRVPPPPELGRADFDALLVRDPTRVLADFSERDIAEQLTILTLHMHNNILPCEFIGGRWLPSSGQTDQVPNFKAYRNLINKVANWACYAVVHEEHFETRVNIVKKLYLVCDALRDMSNWDMLVALHGGMSQGPSIRLTNTHYHVRQSELGRMVGELNELLANQGKTKLLQDLMIMPPDRPQPRFPSIVVYLHQLKIMEDHPATIDGQINFFRMSLEHNKIKYLLCSKGVKLPYEPIPRLLGAFTLFKTKDHSELNQLSHRCEPGEHGG